jgi:hypothetical protein
VTTSFRNGGFSSRPTDTMGARRSSLLTGSEPFCTDHHVGSAYSAKQREQVPPVLNARDMKKPNPLKLGAYGAACGYMALWVVASYSEGWPFTARRSPAPSDGGQQPVLAAVRDTLTSPAIMVQPRAPVCTELRKKLWVERDGWIIRRVTICR